MRPNGIPAFLQQQSLYCYLKIMSIFYTKLNGLIIVIRDRLILKETS